MMICRHLLFQFHQVISCWLWRILKQELVEVESHLVCGVMYRVLLVLGS